MGRQQQNITPRRYLISQSNIISYLHPQTIWLIHAASHHIQPHKYDVRSYIACAHTSPVRSIISGKFWIIFCMKYNLINSAWKMEKNNIESNIPNDSIFSSVKVQNAQTNYMSRINHGMKQNKCK
eukprot:125901_1